MNTDTIVVDVCIVDVVVGVVDGDLWLFGSGTLYDGDLREDTRGA